MTQMPLQTSTPVTIGDVKHDVRYPLVGDKFKIENLKMLLTNGQYGELSRSGHATALHYLDIVDAFAYFMVLVPALELDVDKFEKLNGAQEMDMRKAYNEEYLPFFLSTNKLLKGEKKDDKPADTTK